jgi:multidrug efflux pump subunit AcrB
MSVIRYSIANPLVVNLLLVVVLVMGVLAWRALPQEIFPVVQLDMAHILTEFEGASPAEVEQQVTITIEEEFEENEDIDYIASISSEDISNIYIKLKPGSDVENFMRDARTILDRVRGDLPDLAEEPELTRIRARFPVISLSVSGDVAHAALYSTAERVRRQMLQIPGVASVAMAGDRDWELWVIVDPYELAARRVPLDTILRALRDNLRDLPGGAIKAIEGDIRLRGQGVAPEPRAIADIVLRANETGGQLRLGDVARVQRRFEEPRTYARFNGKPSVNLVVTKTADASTIEVSRRVQELADDLRHSLPQSISIGHHTDMSVYVKSRLNTVKSSAIIGLILVLLSLYLLLNFRAAVITAAGIPVSFLITFALLYYFGYTINMVSLFAFLIVLGLIVDDAIIVTENVYRHIENGMDPARAAEVGAREVLWPVVVCILTTISAFLPMFAIGGIYGAFIEVIPVVVTCALLGSLWEAFVVLPGHAARWLKPAPKPGRSAIHWTLLLDRYTRWVRWAAVNRYLVAVAAIGILAVSLAYARTRLPFHMFGEVEIGQFFVNIEAPNTYSLEDSLALARQLESTVLDTIDADTEFGTMLTNVGVSIIDFNRVKTGSNQIQLIVDLKKPQPKGLIERWVTPLVNFGSDDFGPRLRYADDIINALRARLALIPGVQRLSILKPDAGPAGDDIEIGVIGQNQKLLESQAQAITRYLRQVPGVHDVQHDQEPGKLEYRYELNERGRRLGLTQAQLADAVRGGYLGAEAVHVTWNEKRIPVRVIYPEHLRRQSGSLADLPIVLPSGDTVYLGDVADISIDRGLNNIRRRDHQRMAKITAQVDSQVTTPLVVLEQIQREFNPADPDAGYELLFLGEKKNFEESFSGMYHALVIALALIFFMLAWLFKSLLDPLVVMLAIPFSFIGVVAGHALFGYNLQFLSIVGMLALAGIVVDDALVLVDFIKQRRRAGADRVQAVVEGCRLRARPILLTSITTFLGISPLIFFATGQAAFLSPMAVALGFGLITSTAVALLVMPSLYLIADDLKNRLLLVLFPARSPAAEPRQ